MENLFTLAEGDGFTVFEGEDSGDVWVRLDSSVHNGHTKKNTRRAKTGWFRFLLGGNRNMAIDATLYEEGHI